jgi:hypothetical protein
MSKPVILVRATEDVWRPLSDRLVMEIRHPDGYSTVDLVEADTPSAKNQHRRALQSPRDVVLVCGMFRSGSWKKYVDGASRVLVCNLAEGRFETGHQECAADEIAAAVMSGS